MLGSLYFSQGLPFGFFTLALPIVLRARGLSLEAVGASGLLALPWALKFVWGPVVDRFGTRRAWILPLQLATAGLFVALCALDPTQDLEVLGVGMLLASVLASTQDVATDALAVALLGEEDRGIGNGLQVGAYRLGMIVGGGGILVLYDQVGAWAGFLAMSALLLVATLPVVALTEPPRQRLDAMGLRQALAAFPAIGLHWWLVLLVYKAGEAAASQMVKALLVDAGWSTSGIGVLLGFGGSAAGLVGALIGGAVVGRVGRRAALVGFGLLSAAAIASFALPAVLGATRLDTAVVVVLEHLTSGMATASLFTAMMDKCRRGHEATDYTLQACAVVIATGFAASSSGWAAAHLGYAGHFGLCAAIGLVAVALVAR